MNHLKITLRDIIVLCGGGAFNSVSSSTGTLPESLEWAWAYMHVLYLTSSQHNGIHHSATGVIQQEIAIWNINISYFLVDLKYRSSKWISTIINHVGVITSHHFLHVYSIGVEPNQTANQKKPQYLSPNILADCLRWIFTGTYKQTNKQTNKQTHQLIAITPAKPAKLKISYEYTCEKYLWQWKIRHQKTTNI